nr:hypothetical protein GCM10020092_019300 [Actinoplanes digitatis]
MRRVEADEDWSLIDPSDAPELPDLYGEEFEAAYRIAESKAVKTVKARDLYGRMMRTLAQTGNGWMTFKDPSNRLSNQTGHPGNTIHLSNLCTEILEVSADDETAVCNLGSINLGAHLTGDDVDWAKLRETARTAVVFLDRVIDINYYPSEQAAASNPRWRPVGLGLMGLQDAFFALGLPFDSAAARELSTRVSEEIYLTALETSASLAERFGTHPAYPETRAARGDLQPDLWGVTPHAVCPVGGGARADRGHRPAQFAADRDRADGDDRLHRRLLRVHRTAGQQPFQARDPERRVPSDQHLSGTRAEGARPLDVGGARADQACRGLGAGRRDAAERRSGSSSGPRGSCRRRRSLIWPRPGPPTSTSRSR